MAELPNNKYSAFYTHGENDAVSTADEVSKLHILTHKLTERIKELNCLYGISQLVEQNITMDTMMRAVVGLIPSSWQYPDITCARIKLSKQEYSTDNFQETAWRQTDTIYVNGKNHGTVEVYYLEEKPPQDEGPFLQEERYLIHMIAERLGHVIERKLSQIKLESLYKREKKTREKLQLEMQNRIAFTRNLIHELKTPLTSLIATSQLLVEETEGNRLEKLSRFVWESANNLNIRIDKLHDVVKGETGDLEMDLAPLDIAKLIKSVTDETEALAKQNGIEVILEIEACLPMVYADGDRTVQVILNLLNNAFKYAGEGAKVIIKANKKNEYVLTEIRDYGPGISPMDLHKIFEPGYQRMHRDKVVGGLGIGLSLCKMLVELQGGKIWAQSKIRRGASFFFTLPVIKQDQVGQVYRYENSNY